jgi:hypothetical protein
MSETVKNLVDAINSKDALAMEAAFQSAMAEKISAKLDDMRQDVAKSMFTAQEVVEEEAGGMTDKHAKQAAKEIAKGHKHLKVTSAGGDGHFVHHKDDDEGDTPDIQIHASGGKLHVHHDGAGGMGSDTSEHHDVASAVAHARKHLVHNIPTHI